MLTTKGHQSWRQQIWQKTDPKLCATELQYLNYICGVKSPQNLGTFWSLNYQAHNHDRSLYHFPEIKADLFKPVTIKYLGTRTLRATLHKMSHTALLFCDKPLLCVHCNSQSVFDFHPTGDKGPTQQMTFILSFICPVVHFFKIKTLQQCPQTRHVEILEGKHGWEKQDLKLYFYSGS